MKKYALFNNLHNIYSNKNKLYFQSTTNCSYGIRGCFEVEISEIYQALDILI